MGKREIEIKCDYSDSVTLNKYVWYSAENVEYVDANNPSDEVITSIDNPFFVKIDTGGAIPV
jgi:hypothetical protein